MELKDLNGRWAYITDYWPFDINGILDDGCYFKISQYQEPWDGNEITIRVGTKQIDLRDIWAGDLYLCGIIDRPSDEILTIEGLVKFFSEKLGLKLVPDSDLNFVYEMPELIKKKKQKIIRLKYFRKFEEHRKKSLKLDSKEMFERKKKMIAYRFKKFGIEPSSDLNIFDMPNQNSSN